MPLTDAKIKAAKPKDKAYKLTDQLGLFLYVPPSGGRLWRMKYRYGDKERLLSFGRYPEINLKQARAKRDEARKLLADNIDPTAEKKRQAVAAQIALGNTFGLICHEYLEKIEADGLSPVTMTKNRWLASQLIPALGHRPIADIEPIDVLAVVKKIEKLGNHDSAKRVCAFASRVFRYAIITSRLRFNPAAELSGALITPKVKHHAAITDPQGVGSLLRAIDAYDGFITTKLALKIAPHLFVRPGELRHAEWSEIDLEAKVWRIPAAKMKMRNDHAVPLSHRAIDILEQVSEITGGHRYVFASVRSHLLPMSENTLNAALRSLGYGHDQMTSHGFRSTASTLLNESGMWSSDAIEHALAHKDSNRVRAAYHRGTHWDERVKMMQWWSDYLDQLKRGGEVVPFKIGNG